MIMVHNAQLCNGVAVVDGNNRCNGSGGLAIRIPVVAVFISVFFYYFL